MGAGLHDEAIGHAPLPHHFMGERHDESKHNRVSDRHHGFGGPHGDGEEDSGGQNEKKERSEKEHERVHVGLYIIPIFLFGKDGGTLLKQSL